MKDEPLNEHRINAGGMDIKKRKWRTLFQPRGTRHAVFVFSATLCVLFVGYLLFQSLQPSPSAISSSLLPSSQENSGKDATQSINSEDSSSQTFYTIKVEIPLWFSPGKLKVGDVNQAEWGSTSIEGITSGGYVYINEKKAALLKTGEHKDCKYIRFNTATGTLECLDHIIRSIMMPGGKCQPGDEIYIHSGDCSDRYILFYLNHNDAAYRGSFRLDLVERTFARLPIDLRKDDYWQISKDYSYLVIGEYTNRWRYYRVDIMTNAKTEILETEENTTYSFGLTKTNRYFWYATYHGQSKDTWCYYNLETGVRRTFHTIRIFCVTPDDQYVVYCNETGLRRMELESGKDILLVERGTDPYWEDRSIEAYNPSSGKVLLSWWPVSAGQILYIYDTVTQQGEMLIGFDESLDQSWRGSFRSDSKVDSGNSEEESLRNTKGVKARLMDKNCQYVFFYTDAPGHEKYIYCYSMVAGELFKVEIPDTLFEPLQQQIKDQSDHSKSLIIDYRLYLSDDATRIYLTYEMILYDFEPPKVSSVSTTSFSK